MSLTTTSSALKANLASLGNRNSDLSHTLATALLTTDVTLAFDSPRNPGYDLSVIKDYLDRLDVEKLVDSNRVTLLRGYTRSGDEGVCHLTCWRTPSRGFGPVRSQWVLWVSRQDDGQWLISRITCVSINDRPASRYR